MNLNIVFAVDNNGFEMMAVALYSVIKNNRKHRLNFYVLHKNISESNIIRLKKIEKKFSNTLINVRTVEEGRFENVEVNNKNVTTEAFFRYLAPEVLHEEARALYIDYDMLCLADLEELYTTDLGLKFIGAVPDYVVEHNFDFRNFKKGIGFGENEKYANSGLLLFDLKGIRNSSIMDTFWNNVYNKDKLIAKEFNIFADQTLMNITFKGKVKFLNARYNVFTTVLKDTKQKNPVIIHFTGPYKPLTYRNEYTTPYDEMYDIYHQECIKIIGGDPFNLAKGALKRLSREVDSVANDLEIKNRLCLNQKEQLDDAYTRISRMDRRITELQALIAEERRFKNSLRNLVLSIDRKIMSVLSREQDHQGFGMLISRVLASAYRLARKAAVRVMRFIFNSTNNSSQ